MRTRTGRVGWDGRDQAGWMGQSRARAPRRPVPLHGDATALPSLRGRTEGTEEGWAWCQCHLRAVTVRP